MDLLEILELGERQPLIVFGGKSRSGKTTLAERQATHLKEKGKSVSLINIDNYLGGEGYWRCRNQEMGYYPIEREMQLKFDYERVASDIAALLGG